MPLLSQNSIQSRLGWAAAVCVSLMVAAPASAGSLLLASSDSPRSMLLASNEDSWKTLPGTLIAQSEGGDDAYDPFADYSEFEESADEEEDLNFFRNGRLLTIGFLGGFRGWTDRLGKLYTGNPAFGLYICYFFDLRFALQFGYLTSDHTITLAGPTVTVPGQGNVSISDISFNLKYYLNTQNVTRGLADLNPYFIGGFSQIYRTITVSGFSEFGKDSAFAANFGAGIEIPMLRNKMYFGGQLMYQLVNFPDENKTMVDSGNNPTGIQPRGDSFMALGILGVNF